MPVNALESTRWATAEPARRVRANVAARMRTGFTVGACKRILLKRASSPYINGLVPLI
jgi:hypothetical protein